MTSKKLEEKQLRRQAEERREAERKSSQRKRSLLTLGLALLVGALVVGLVMSERSKEETVATGVDPSEAGCSEIVEHELLGRDHVEDGSPVEYNSSPPTSGSHYANFADPAFYAEPIEPERLVHNLEHGQVVVWYSPDAPQETIDSLETYVSGELPGILAAPYDGEFQDGSGDYVLGAWGANQVCSEFSTEVVEEFREQYQGKGPEPVGIPTFSPE